MQRQVNKVHTNDFMDSLEKEFDGHGIYGVEFILDELNRQKTTEVKNQLNDGIDWFGLSDLSI